MLDWLDSHQRAEYQGWLDWVRQVENTIASGGLFPRRSVTPPSRPSGPARRPGAAKVVVCSPHPDDEALVGALPLRLRLESGAEVVNCAITLGSDPSQRARRLQELKASCRVLGFHLAVMDSPEGIDETRLPQPSQSTRGRELLARRLAVVFEQEQPEVIIYPHADDLHPTHVMTHGLVREALAQSLRSKEQLILLAEAEYWRQMDAPNLMIGVSAETEALLVMAVAKHRGEVVRNPYHLRHPARLIDNVRRGSEVVGKTGGAACHFSFAELYRVNHLRGDGVAGPCPAKLMVSPSEAITLEMLRSHFLSGETDALAQQRPTEGADHV